MLLTRIMERESEDINTNNIDSKTDIEIKEEPWWLEEPSTGTKPEPDEPLVSESEMQNKIKIEVIEVPEIPHKRQSNIRALRVRQKKIVSRHRRRTQARKEYYASLMELLEKQHTIEMETMKMKTELLEMELENQKKLYEIELLRMERYRKEKELREQQLLRQEMSKTKSE